MQWQLGKNLDLICMTEMVIAECQVVYKPSSYSVQFSCSVVSNSLRPHKSQHARPPCPPPFLMIYSAYKLNKQGDTIQPKLEFLYQNFKISLIWPVHLGQMALPGISSNGWRLGSCATDLVDGDPFHWIKWYFYFQFFKESPHCSP